MHRNRFEHGRTASRWHTMVMLGASAALGCNAGGVSDLSVTSIAVDTAMMFQTISGWEAVDEGGHEEVPGYMLYRDSLIKLAVNDLGITRLRLGLRSGYEQKTDAWRAWVNAGRKYDFRCVKFRTDNDNDDPFDIDWRGFHFDQLNLKIEMFDLPFKKAVEARGDKLQINANYASFMVRCPRSESYHHAAPEEYAEYVLAVHLHLRDKYGLVPDLWEVILEPENTYAWSGSAIGEAIVAASRRLKAQGFHTRFIAPSTTRAANAPRYFAEMIEVPGVLEHLEELAYHRYREIEPADIAAIGDLAKRHGVKTAMLEHIGSGYEDLHEDLKVGQVSAWEQFALAYSAREDDGAQYYLIESGRRRTPAIKLGERTRYLRQYFRYIRPGAVRVAAVSTDSVVDAVAFRGPEDRAVVVMKTETGARIALKGLPPGTYQGRYTTERETDVPISAVTTDNGEFEIRMPAKGVITVFRQSRFAKPDLGEVH